MPYADRDRQRAYNREWAKRRGVSAGSGPLAQAILGVLQRATRPLSPSTILELLPRFSTVGSVSVTLDRMKRAGFVNNIGYGSWVVTDDGKPSSPESPKANGSADPGGVAVPEPPDETDLGGSEAARSGGESC